jgi:hypothetical protein
LVALVALPNLYCNPQDVFDWLGTEGVQLRLDDENLATGQQIAVTANASAGATSLAVTALSFPLLPGTVLEFNGGNMPVAPSEAVLTAVGKVGDTTLTVAALTNAVNVYATARDSGVNYALGQRLVKGCKYGTSRVKLYCSGRYQDSDLATCWSANRWATTFAAQWLCRRRAQPCPKSIEEDAKDALTEMMMVQSGKLQLEDIGTRTAGWPFLSNLAININYDYARLRVEPPLSEPTPTQYAQWIDWNSALYLEVW